MIDPVIVVDIKRLHVSVPTYPLRVVSGQAVDSRGFFVYEKSTLSPMSFPLKWADIQNEPGWQNGYPPGHSGQNPVCITINNFHTSRTDMAKTRVDVCDCGMAASDYSVSRDGGPGHSDWCKVAGK